MRLDKMKTCFIIISMSIILCCAIGCISPQTHNDEKLSYIVWDSLENTDFLVEPYTSLEFVKLETNGNCVINEIYKIEVDDSLIFIEDYMQRLYLFHDDGRFVCRIGSKGGANNEYVTMFDFVLNRENKQVYIIDSSKGEIVVYDYNGRHLGNKHFDPTTLSHSVKVALVDDDSFATINFNSPDEKSNFSIWDTESQRVTDYIEYISVGNIRSHSEVGRMTYQSSSLLMCAELSDTIYTCNNRIIHPLYVFQSLAKHSTKNDIQESVYDFGSQAASKLLKDGFSSGIINLYATEQIISFQCRANDGFYRIFYNTETKKGYKFDMTKNLDAVNTALWNFLKTSSSKAFVCALPVGDFISKEKVRKSYPELNDLLANSKDEDNPILAFFIVSE